ncbi:hypothetical protein D3C86_2158970 [compost metagenome]
MVKESLIHAAFEMPGQDIVIEEVPVVSRRDACADTGARNHQAFGSKRLHRFAKNCARHLETRRQFRIAGQDRPDRELA